eukprot:TRINITY_DN5786_c0_g1_i2.p2 TRINITY_DN5786_c0_g1~~TRINITY_DN5786_c0_g1_i2.p2  ORF type:complete len:181 (-),score=14.55 TRINITY_DN5786_c0_g1_i2:291-833(-)
MLSCEYNWQDLKRYENKLKLAIMSSTCICAAYCKKKQLQKLGYDIEGWSDKQDTEQKRKKELWPFLKEEEKILIGFARASGDTIYCGLIYDVVVHPQLRNIGIGYEVTRRVVNQLGKKDIQDVGLICPTEIEGFFRKVWFSYDELQTTPMLFKYDTVDLIYSNKVKQNSILAKSLLFEKQ